MMVIVSVKDGEAFNLFRAPKKYLRSKGLTAKEGDDPGEQPPVAVLHALAAAGGAPDWFQDAALTARLQALAVIEDHAVFAREPAQLTEELP